MLLVLLVFSTVANAQSADSGEEKGEGVEDIKVREQVAGKTLERLLSTLDPHTSPGAASDPPYVTKVRECLCQKSWCFALF